MNILEIIQDLIGCNKAERAYRMNAMGLDKETQEHIQALFTDSGFFTNESRKVINHL